MAHYFLTTLATLLIVFISISPLPTIANDDDIVVLDTNGDPLVAGAFYYAVPAASESTLVEAGGLTMFNNDSVTCPEFIVSRSNMGPQDLGIPLVFFPQDPQQTYVQHGFSDYNIAFKYLSILPECRRLYTTVWTISTEATTETLVVLDGEKGDQSSWFKIKKSDDNVGYMIRYSSTSLGGSMSKDVGVVSNEQGATLLSIADGATSLVVVFVKAA